MHSILIVDDEYLIADILGFAMEDEGFLVHTASNGQKALDVLRRESVDLVITDYMMPVINGGELGRAIKNDPQLCNVPIILMSGAQASHGRDAPSIFSAVFDKPFDMLKMIAKVHELLDVPATGNLPFS